MSEIKVTIKPLVSDRRRICATKKFQPVFQPKVRNTTSTFARAIMQRYEAQQNLGSRMNLTFQQNAPVVTLRSTRHYHQTQFSPHLSFALLNWQQPVAQQSLSLPLVKFHQSLVATEELIYRLITRSERIETVTSTTVPAKSDSFSTDTAPLTQISSLDNLLAPLALLRQISPADYLLQAQPVSKVFRQTAPPVVLEPSLSEQQYQRSPGANRYLSNHPNLAADLTNSIDLNRLTDRVVQAIDRRMTAYRERLGRI